MSTDLSPALRAAVEVMAEAAWKSRVKRMGSIVSDDTIDRAPREIWQSEIPDATAALRALVAAGWSVQPPGPKWRHKKRGTVYTEIGRGTFQLAGDSVMADEEKVVIYRGDDGALWARPQYEFEDGRFEPIAFPPEAGADDGR